MTSCSPIRQGCWQYHSHRQTSSLNHGHLQHCHQRPNHPRRLHRHRPQSTKQNTQRWTSSERWRSLQR